jgi:hypothetical protein
VIIVYQNRRIPSIDGIFKKWAFCCISSGEQPSFAGKQDISRFSSEKGADFPDSVILEVY